MKDKEIIKQNIENNGRMGWLNEYLNFKADCIKNNIIDLDEIIKLYQAWISC